MNLFVAISCMGTLNGLMLGCTRGIYAVATRGESHPEMFRQVDEVTNMPNNASILGLLLCGFWFLFFFTVPIWRRSAGSGCSALIPRQLPIVTIYALYIPIYLMFMKKATDLSFHAALSDSGAGTDRHVYSWSARPSTRMASSRIWRRRQTVGSLARSYSI